MERYSSRSMLTMRILPKRLGKWNWKMILSWVCLTSPRGLRRRSITNIIILPDKKRIVSLHSNCNIMIDEKVILRVLAEQQEEIKSYKPQKWVARKEESLFE